MNSVETKIKKEQIPVSETESKEAAVSETEPKQAPVCKTEPKQAPVCKIESKQAPVGETESKEAPVGETELNEALVGETESNETESNEAPVGETESSEAPVFETDPKQAPVVETSCIAWSKLEPLKRKRRCSGERLSTNKLNNYNKKQILTYLITNGCGEKSCSNVFSSIKADPVSSLAYMNERITLAQQHVYQECDSLCFQNNNNWLEHFKKISKNEQCYFEAASVVLSLAENEKHPDPKNFGGVDLKQVYRFLGNALYGNPQPELNRESQIFLAEEFESLINMANSSEADEQTKKMKALLESRGPLVLEEDGMKLSHLSLDPFDMDSTLQKALDLED